MGEDALDNEDLATSIERGERRKTRLFAVIAGVLLATSFLFCLVVGRYTTGVAETFAAFAYGVVDTLIDVLELPTLIPGVAYEIPNPVPIIWDTTSYLVLWTIRLPRMLGVVFVGGGLAMAGASYQGVFRNPLVSESILGVTAGAAFGAGLGFFFYGGQYLIMALAFVGAMLAVAATYFSSRAFNGNPTLLLVLAGTVVGSLFSAGLTVLQYLIGSEDARLGDIVFWLMGSFSKVGGAEVAYLVVGIAACALVLNAQRWKLNVLSLGDEEAKALGVDTTKTRLVIILAATLLTAIAVSVCGTIGWVGLVVPQMVRMLIGPDNRRLIPLCFFFGGTFMLLIDCICRSLISSEIPIGVATAIIGAPLFLVILRRLNRGWA